MCSCVRVLVCMYAFMCCVFLPLSFPTLTPHLSVHNPQAMQGDIVCLQEVQMDHFEMHLSPFMHELGFDGLFKSKSRESMGQYGKVDGCATFWKLAKFSMTEHYTIEFNDLARCVCVCVCLCGPYKGFREALGRL